MTFGADPERYFASYGKHRGSRRRFSRRRSDDPSHSKGVKHMTENLPVEVLEQIVSKALEKRDMEGVAHALKLIAVQNPARAQVLLDTLNLGIEIASHE